MDGENRASIGASEHAPEITINPTYHTIESSREVSFQTTVHIKITDYMIALSSQRGARAKNASAGLTFFALVTIIIQRIK